MGEPCAANLFQTCEAYARCGADGKCGPIQTLGKPCTNDQQCYSKRCVNKACAASNACAD